MSAKSYTRAEISEIIHSALQFMAQTPPDRWLAEHNGVLGKDKINVMVAFIAFVFGTTHIGIAVTNPKPGEPPVAHGEPSFGEMTALVAEVDGEPKVISSIHSWPAPVFMGADALFHAFPAGQEWPTMIFADDGVHFTPTDTPIGVQAVTDYIQQLMSAMRVDADPLN